MRGARRGLLLAIGASAIAHAQLPPPAALLRPVELFETTRALAGEQNWPIGEIGPLLARHPVSGDELTAVVELREPAGVRQWLIHVRIADLAPAEPGGADDYVMHTSTGLEVRFPRGRGELSVATAGPLTRPSDGGANSPPQVRRATVEVNPALLAVGFDRAAATMRRVTQAARKLAPPAPAALSESDDPRERAFGFSFSERPFAGEELARGRALAEQLAMSDDDMRAMAGANPALTSFFEIARRTPGLQEIIEQVVERPSLMSIVRRGGRIETGLVFESRAVSLIDEYTPAPQIDAPVYALPLALTINDRTALRCVYAVARPAPPLLTSAGILGFVAEAPGQSGRMLVLQVIGTRVSGGE